MRKNTQRSSLLGTLKNPTSLLVMLGFAFLLFDVQYLMMSQLPGSRDEMCVMGAGLNAPNITFAILMSLMGGLFLVGFIETIKARKSSFKALSTSSTGAVLGSLTVFCPACTLPVLSVFGASYGFTFFTTYELWIKGVSLILISCGLYQIDKQIKGNCTFCVD
jgi:hypothetical protein